MTTTMHDNYDPARLIATADDPRTPWEDIGPLIAIALGHGDKATADTLGHIEYIRYKRRHF